MSSNDKEVFKKFWCNSKMYYDQEASGYVRTLHLNIALVNHSCSPNATNRNLKTLNQIQQKGKQDHNVELRAIKDIRKGEEITLCYVKGLEMFGSNLRKRRPAFKKDQGFDCKCPVCLDQVPVQEKTLKKLIEQHNKLNPKPTDWKREAGVWSRIVDLTMELYIGSPNEKVWALDALARFAHLARDKVLLRKAVDKLKQFAEYTKLEDVHRFYEDRERCMAQWSTEFSSNSAPKKREIDIFLSSLKDVFYQYS